MTKTFFQDSVKKGHDSHLKAFASETLAAVQVLALFCDAVLRPIDALPEHVRCFDYLRVIIDIVDNYVFGQSQITAT